MRSKSFPGRSAALVLASFIAAMGCSHVGVSRSAGAGYGPPGHAPVHGYRSHARAHHADYELRFDSDLGVHVVGGLQDVYFHADRFYRNRNGSWELALRLDGPWSRASTKSLPPGLAKRHGKGRGGPKGHASQTPGRR